MTQEIYTNQGLGTVTSGGTTTTTTDTAWTVSVSQAFPSPGTGQQFHVADTASGYTTEIVTVAAGNSGAVGTQSWTVVRGAEGTTPIAHAAGFTVRQVVPAGAYGSYVDETSAQTVSGKTLQDTVQAVASPSISSGALTLDLSQGNVQQVTLNQDVTSVSFANTPAAGEARISLWLTQDGTGGRTVTWPASVTWLSGAAPAISATAGTTTEVVLATRDGGTAWSGWQPGAGFANPMTGAGDMISGGSGGTPERLAAGSPSQSLLAGDASEPLWVTEYLSARAFGAVGNGTADDTSALQTWVTAINASGNGALALLEPGNYLVKSPPGTITNNGVTITGAGWVESASGGTAGSVISASGWTGGNTPLLTLAGEGIQLEKISVNAGGAATTAVAVTGLNCQFQYMSVRGVSHGSPATPALPATSGTAVQNTTGQCVTVSVTGGTGVSVQVTFPGQAAQTFGASLSLIVVPNNGYITLSWTAAPSAWAWSGLGVCVDVQNGGKTTWLTSCRFDGINTPSAGVMVNDTDLIMTGCKPETNTYSVLLLSGATGAKLSGNHWTNGSGTGGSGALLYGNASHVEIADNRFDNFAASAIQMIPPTSPPVDICITDNDFYSAVLPAATYALIALDTTNSGVRGLRVVGNSGYANATTLPAWGLAAQTSTGGTPAGASRLASYGSVAAWNSWWVATSSFGNASPAVAFGNYVAVGGSAPAWEQDTDIYGFSSGTFTGTSVDVATAGQGLRVAEGANAKQGTATLASGTVTVSSTAVTATSRILLTAQDNNTTGALRVSARTAGTSFTITSSVGTDSGAVAYEIFEPG